MGEHDLVCNELDDNDVSELDDQTPTNEPTAEPVTPLWLDEQSATSPGESAATPPTAAPAGGTTGPDAPMVDWPNSSADEWHPPMVAPAPLDEAPGSVPMPPWMAEPTDGEQISQWSTSDASGDASDPGMSELSSGGADSSSSQIDDAGSSPAVSSSEIDLLGALEVPSPPSGGGGGGMPSIDSVNEEAGVCIDGVETPELPTDPLASTEETVDGRVSSHEEVAEGLPEAGEENIPDNPERDAALARLNDQDDPASKTLADVPDASAALDEAANQTLSAFPGDSDSTAQALFSGLPFQRSPRSNLEIDFSQQALSAQSLDVLLVVPAELPALAEDATPEQRAQHELLSRQNSAILQTRNEILIDGGVELNDLPADQAQRLEGYERRAVPELDSLDPLGHVGATQPRTPAPPPVTNPELVHEVLAELVATADTRAERILDRCRVAAFPRGLLQQLMPTIGNSSYRDTLRDDLTGHLGEMAEAAGISARALAISADERSAQLAEEAWMMEADLATDGSTLRGEIQTAESDLQAATDAGQDRVTNFYNRLTRVAQFDQDQNPWLTLRDVLNADIERRCAEMKAQYKEMKTARPQALATERQRLIGAVDRVKQLEEIDFARTRSFATPEAARTAMRSDEQMQAVVTWHADLTTSIARSFRGRLTADRREIDGFIRTVDKKRKTARWAVVDFVDPHLGFWDSLITVFDEWLHSEEEQASAETAQWHQRQNQANAAAISGDMAVLDASIMTMGNEVVTEATIAGMQLSEEQAAILRAYYLDGESRTAAVARGIEERLTQQMQPEVVRRLEELAIEQADWETLDQLARSRNSGFRATNLVRDLDNAFDGGLLEGGTIESLVFSTLEGLSPLEIAALRSCWDSSHDETLDQALASELDDDLIFDDNDDPDLDRARELMSGNQAAADARAIHQALTSGWFGGDSDAVDSMFAGKPLEERDAIVAEYQRIYGTSLDSAIAEHLDDDWIWDDDQDVDADQARAFASGDDLRARSIGAYDALDGWNNEQKFWNNMEGVRADATRTADAEGFTHAQLQAEIRYQMGEMEGEFGTYATQWSSLQEAVDDDWGGLSGDNNKIAHGYRDNDMNKVNAGFLALQYDMLFDDDNEIVRRMQSAETRAIEEVERDQGSRVRQQFIAQIQSGNISPELRLAGFAHQLPGPPGSWPTLQRAALERAIAAEIRRRAAPITQENHQQMETVYANEYSTSWHDQLSSNATFYTSGYQQDQVASFSKYDGVVPLHVQIHNAVSNYATDPATLRRVYGSLTPDQIAVVAADYHNEYGSVMETDVNAALDGDGEEHDISILMQGQATTVFEQRERMRQQVLWEATSGSDGWRFGGVFGPTDIGIERWVDGEELPDADSGTWMTGIGGEDREMRSMLQEWQQFDQNIEAFRDRALRERWQAEVAHISNPFERFEALEARREAYDQLSPEERAEIDEQLYWEQAASGDNQAFMHFNRLAGGSIGVTDAQAQLREEAAQFERDATRVWSVTVAVAGIVVGIILAPETGGGSLAATIAGISSLVGAGGGMAIKSMARGEGYGDNEMWMDVAVGTVDAVLAASTAGLGGRLRGPLDEAGRDLMMLQGRLADFGAAVRRIPPSRLLSQMASSQSRLGRAGAFIISEGIEQTVANAPGAILGSAIDERTYRSGNALTSTLSATGTKVGMATALSVGIGGGTALFRSRGALPDVPLVSDAPGPAPGVPRPDQSFDDAFASWRATQEGPVTEVDYLRSLSRQLNDPHLPRTDAEWEAHTQRLAADPEGSHAEFLQSAFMDASARAHDLHGQRSALGEGLRTDATPEQQAVLQDLPGDVVDEAAFARLPGPGTDDLKVVTRDGQVYVVQRAGSTPTAADFATIRGLLESAVVPGSGGRPVDLADLLPRDLQRGVRVEAMPEGSASQSGARIEPVVSPDGTRYLGFVLRVGADADMVTIRAHLATVRALKQFSGMRHRLRVWFRQRLGRDVRDLRSTEHEVSVEVGKLEALIHARSQQLLEGDITPERAEQVAAGVAALEREINGHLLRLELQQTLANVDGVGNAPAAGEPTVDAPPPTASEQVQSLRQLADRLDANGDADSIAEAARLRQMAARHEIDQGGLDAAAVERLEWEIIDQEWVTIAHEIDTGVELSLDMQAQLGRAFRLREVDELRRLADQIDDLGPDAAAAAARMRQVAAQQELTTGNPSAARRAALEEEILDLEWSVIDTDLDTVTDIDVQLRERVDQVIRDRDPTSMRQVADALDRSGADGAAELAARLRLRAIRSEIEANPDAAGQLAAELSQQQQRLLAAGTDHPELDLDAQAARASTLQQADQLFDIAQRIRANDGPQSDLLSAIPEREGLRLMLDNGSVTGPQAAAFRQRITELDALIHQQVPDGDQLSALALGYIASDSGGVVGLPRFADRYGLGDTGRLDVEADGSVFIDSGSTLDNIDARQADIEASFADESGPILHRTALTMARHLESQLDDVSVALEIRFTRNAQGEITSAQYEIWASHANGDHDLALEIRAAVDDQGRFVIDPESMQAQPDAPDYGAAFGRGLRESGDQAEVLGNLDRLINPDGPVEVLPPPSAGASGTPATAAQVIRQAQVDDSLPAAEATGADVPSYLADLRARSTAHGRGSHGGRWKWAEYPDPPSGLTWQVGDPIDMPDANGNYPAYSTAQVRYWLNRVHFERQARLQGRASQDPNSVDPLHRATDASLEWMLTDATGTRPARRAGRELEHNAAPQRAVTALEQAGFDTSTARMIAHVSHPDSLIPLPVADHAAFDHFRQGQASDIGTYDERVAVIDGNPDHVFANLPEPMVRRMIDIFNQQGGTYDMGRTAASRAARDSFIQRARELGIYYRFP